MATKWYHNAKTGEIDSYEVCGTLTDLSRGVLLAYGDYLTTGFNTQEEAEKWGAEWSACLECESAFHGKNGDPCPYCSTPLISKSIPKIQVEEEDLIK